MKLNFEKKLSLPFSPAKALKVSTRHPDPNRNDQHLTIETNYEQKLNDRHYNAQLRI
jgi:hypothetical protein